MSNALMGGSVNKLVGAVGVSLVCLFSYAFEAYSADYAFSAQDPRVVQEKFIQDLQSGVVRSDNFGQSARQMLIQFGAQIYGLLNQLGEITEVCPTSVKRFPNGGDYTFRSRHVRGQADWSVFVSFRPEIIENFLVFPVGGGAAPGGGEPPPAVLVFPDGPNLPPPPVEIDCRRPGAIVATPQEIEDACRKWPRMC